MITPPTSTGTTTLKSPKTGRDRGRERELRHPNRHHLLSLQILLSPPPSYTSLSFNGPLFKTCTTTYEYIFQPGLASVVETLKHENHNTVIKILSLYTHPTFYRVQGTTRATRNSGQDNQQRTKPALLQKKTTMVLTVV